MTKDPLLKVARPEARVLFEQLSERCQDHSVEDIVTASGNLLINALRQAHPTRQSADVRLDEISANLKKLLDQHYDSFGRLKGVYPYHQSIEMPLFDARGRERK